MKTKASIVAVAGTLAVIIIYMLATTRFDSKQGFLENNWDIIFWMLAGIGALALLVFGLKSRTSTPTAGAAPAKSKLPIWLKWCLWIGGIALVAFSAYKWWSSLEYLWGGILDSANNTITKEITIDSLRGTSWDDIPKGTYVISLSGPGYLYKCHPEKPGTRDGYPEGKRADGGKMDGWTGGIRISSPLTADRKGDGGTVRVGSDGNVSVGFDVECPDTGTIVYPATAFVRLTPTTIK